MPTRLTIATALAITLLGLLNLHAQTGVWLKTEAGFGRDRAASTLKRYSESTWRYLVVFERAPGSAELAAVEALGAQPLEWVPERGLIVAAPDGVSLDALGAEWYGKLRPEQKISPALVDAGLLAVSPQESLELEILVEFHRDVPRAHMFAIAAEEKLSALAHPDLVSWQMLVRGPIGRLAALASWDEVAYLFPAARELASGQPVEACQGALSSYGRIGQIVARIGEGWDGPGRGAAELRYVFSALTGRLTPTQVRQEFERAMAEWSRHAALRFLPGDSAQAPRTINILFQTRDHGDGYPFDGPGKVLAHTFYPAPPNPEPIAGDLHIDDDEPWQNSAAIDLYGVVLHELGHALGLGHADSPEAVMYPYYRRVSQLHAIDIEAIRSLYAAAFTGTQTPQVPLELTIGYPGQSPYRTRLSSVAVGGTARGGTAPISIQWTNGRGLSGVASGVESWTVAQIPLQVGPNTITITAVDAQSQRVSRQLEIIRETDAASPPQPVSIRIVSPASGGLFSTSEPFITLAGTASPQQRIARIVWTNSRGSGGAIAGAANWTTGPIALEPGRNQLTVTALDVEGGSASAMLEVDYRAPSVDSGADRTAPLLTIVSPATSVFTTSNATISISGTAQDNVAIHEVDWLSSAGRYGKASGTTHWTIRSIPLFHGINTILIRAFDTAGNMSWRALTVTRQ